MKYAVVGPRGMIRRVTEGEPQAVAENATVRELTNEQAEAIEAGQQADPRVRYAFDGDEFVTAEELIERHRPVPSALPVWRIRAVLKRTPHGGGSLHDAVLAALSGIQDEDAKAAAEEIYLGGNVLDRNSPLLQQLAAALSLSEEQVEGIFRAAAAISV